MSGESFKEKGWKSHARWMSEKEYGRALDSLVFATADIIIRDRRGRFVLARRRAEPWNDWWIIGGRMLPGESGLAAARRNFKRETGISLETSRMRFIGVYAYTWARRAQAPRQHGCSGVSLTYAVTLTDREFARIALDPKEYDGSMMRMTAAEIFSAIKKRRLHPALGAVARDLIAAQRQ